MSNKAAKILGSSYAYLQHGIDKVIEWGFDKLQEANKQQSTFKDVKEGHRAIRALRNTVGFIGEAGSVYYKTYEKLKRDDDSKESK
jgi:hypothetical protein